jgi:cyclophilin family peptidyl-prolyl cis-trans isomerase
MTSRMPRTSRAGWLIASLLALPCLPAVARAGDRPKVVVAKGHEASAWNRFSELRDRYRGHHLPPGAAAEQFRALAEELKGSDAEPYARLYQAACHFRAREYERAISELERLKKEFASHYLCRKVSAAEPLVDEYLALTRCHVEWLREHPVDLERPKPDDRVVAVFETSEGRFTIGFFPEHAPKHVENFLRLVREKKLDKTFVFHVYPDFWIKAGDTDAVDPSDKSLWGQGGVPYDLEPEPSKLSCIRGSVVQERPFGPKTHGYPDHGSQFIICVTNPTFLDGSATVFGEVLEGMEVVEAISRIPYEPLKLFPKVDVRIESVTLVEK